MKPKNRRSRSQKILVGIFILIFGLYPAITTAADRSFVYTTPAEMFFRGLIWAAIVISPATGYLLGPRWCRYIFSMLVVLVLIGWSLSPLVQHAIDRHIWFWIAWTIIEAFLFALAWAIFAGPKEVPIQPPQTTTGSSAPDRV